MDSDAGTCFQQLIRVTSELINQHHWRRPDYRAPPMVHPPTGLQLSQAGGRVPPRITAKKCARYSVADVAGTTITLPLG